MGYVTRQRARNVRRAGMLNTVDLSLRDGMQYCCWSPSRELAVDFVGCELKSICSLGAGTVLVDASLPNKLNLHRCVVHTRLDIAFPNSTKSALATESALSEHGSEMLLHPEDCHPLKKCSRHRAAMASGPSSSCDTAIRLQVSQKSSGPNRALYLFVPPFCPTIFSHHGWLLTHSTKAP